MIRNRRRWGFIRPNPRHPSVLLCLRLATTLHLVNVRRCAHVTIWQQDGGHGPGVPGRCDGGRCTATPPAFRRRSRSYRADGRLPRRPVGRGGQDWVAGRGGVPARRNRRVPRHLLSPLRRSHRGHLRNEICVERRGRVTRPVASTTMFFELRYCDVSKAFGFWKLASVALTARLRLGGL